uniref:Uncharacterized protein n=1 Tax=Arundo donax TaxID=35708 RepID=A0A0A9AYU3_ARUDO
MYGGIYLLSNNQGYSCQDLAVSHKTVFGPFIMLSCLPFGFNLVFICLGCYPWVPTP